jgi:hypothetical protein
MRVCVLGAVFLATGCASGSAAGVPDLDAKALYTPKVAAMEGKPITVKISDEREPKPETSPETVKELENTLAEVFRRGGATVSADADSTLEVAIRYMDKPLGGLEREDCVSVELKLTLQGQWRQSSAGGCFAYKHWLGFRMADDPNQTYTTALDTALRQLDRAR